MTEYQRGDVVYVNLPATHSSIQAGVRPCIIVSNDLCNQHSPVISVVPMTTQSKRSLPTHLVVADNMVMNVEGFSFKRSTALCEQIMLISKDMIADKKRAHIIPRIMRKLDKCLQVQLGL